MASTALRYLEDFDVTTCEAEVVEVRQADDGRAVVVLDQTCFYPRGGGQDWDTGVILKGDEKFSVEEVRLDQDVVVWHIGSPHVDWPVGTKVKCEVNVERRTTNTRLHSAGHLVDMALQEFEQSWAPAKARIILIGAPSNTTWATMF